MTMLRLLVILLTLIVITDFIIIEKLKLNITARDERIKLLEYEIRKAMVKEAIYESN